MITIGKEYLFAIERTESYKIGTLKDLMLMLEKEKDIACKRDLPEGSNCTIKYPIKIEPSTSEYTDKGCVKFKIVCELND